MSVVLMAGWKPVDGAGIQEETRLRPLLTSPSSDNNHAFPPEPNMTSTGPAPAAPTPDSEKIDLMKEIISLSKQRGFVFQSSEIYGGLKSCYDYGPLGVELKRNVAAEWWRAMVYSREDIVGLDSSILMHSKVWQTSGHLAGFSDPLVDCLNCKERFRADKAPRHAPGSDVAFKKGGKASGQTLAGKVGEKGYVCPVCSCPDLSAERQFNLMFKTQ